MASFPATLALSSLDGTNGFRIDGVAFGDSSGASVSGAGDVNGDGIADLIIGASLTNTRAGTSYVVFGSSSGFGSSLALSSLDGSNGFRIDGVTSNDQSGNSVSAAGDVNGDGIADVIIGASTANRGLGASYVVYGSRTRFGPSLNLASLDGRNGFRIDGVTPGDIIGNSVSAAGDVNGDGVGDLIIGAYAVNNYAGASYVVYGSSSGFGSTLSLASLDGTNGFRVDGVTTYDYAGGSVSDAGDINDDGLADVVVSGNTTNDSIGESYVVFGASSRGGPSLNLASLNGSNGFRIDGVTDPGQFGISVSAAGDVNADGIADLVVGAYGANGRAGASYVVYGSRSSFGPSLNLASLDGTNGFRIDGVAGGDLSGVSVSAAGDINRDGIADLIIGANGVNNNAGASYVVYGSRAGFGSSLNLASLDGTNGFRIDGVTSGNYSGLSVSAAGDVNGDGGADLIVGARNASGAAGASYVVYGIAPDPVYSLAVSPTTAVPEGTSPGIGTALTYTITRTGDRSQSSTVSFSLGGTATPPGTAGADYSLASGTGTYASTGPSSGTLTLAAGVASASFTLTTAPDANVEPDESVILTLTGLSGRGSLGSTRSTTSTLTNDDAGTGGGDTGGSTPRPILLVGTPGPDSLTSGLLADTIIGAGGDDTLAGLDGADLLLGNEDDDQIYGNQGADSVYGGQDSDTVFGGLGDDFVSGDLGNDLLFGNQGADLLVGGMGADTLYGGTDADMLYGGQGADVLSGDQGDDVLSGDLGADRYVIGPGSGTDLVLGFSQAEGDRLDLQGQTFTLVTREDGAAQLNLSGGGQVILAGVVAGAVNSSYFA